MYQQDQTEEAISLEYLNEYGVEISIEICPLCGDLNSNCEMCRNEEYENE